MKKTVFISIVFSILLPCIAKDIYVNNKTGKDANTGLSADKAFKSIAKAVTAIGPGDRLILANTGKIYNEGMNISVNGTPDNPIVIEGNDAVISGFSKTTSAQWQKVDNGVYSFSTGNHRSRSTAYLTNHGKKIPKKRFRYTSIKDIPPEGYCFVDKDLKFYFRCAEGKTIDDYELGATLIRNGFALNSASYITCRNLKSEYFGNDGFSIHGECRGIKLENVEARHNGDQGISIHEVGGLFVRNAYLHHNGCGIVDVNGSRSVYQGILVENNGTGVTFNGGWHSVTDSIIRNNFHRQLTVEYSSPPRHLPGAEFNPTCQTTAFIRNVLIVSDSKKYDAVMVKKGGRVSISQSIIFGGKSGIAVLDGGVCHLHDSIIDGTGIIFTTKSENFFRFRNQYGKGKLYWLDKIYTPETWEDFLKHAGHDKNSEIGKMRVEYNKNGKVSIQPVSYNKFLKKAMPLKTLKDEGLAQMKTIEEMKEYKATHEKAYKEKTGKDKIWGDTNIPELLQVKGKVIYEDNFENLKNWHHEGGGELTQPEKNLMQLNCIGSKQGKAGCMAFCREDIPDNICIEYDLRVVTSKGLVITFIAAKGRNGEDMITELPAREGIFADYILNPRMRSYHVSVSRYNDKGEHTGVSNWRRNPGIFMMAQQEDLCKKINTWYRITIIKKGGLLQFAVNGKLVGGFSDPDEIPEPIPSDGKVGFRAIGSEVIAQIKNFKIRSLE